MSPRIISSIAALVLITAASQANATIEPAVKSPAPDQSVAEPASVKLASEPAVPSSISLDLSTLPRNSTADQDAAIRALRQYDQMIKADPFALRSRIDPPVYAVKPPVDFNEDRHGKSFDANPRIPYSNYRDYGPYGGDRYRTDYDRLISNQRQQTADRIADMIHPGFGRSEFEIGGNHVRVDYIYAKGCHMRGLGICLRMNFR